MLALQPSFYRCACNMKQNQFSEASLRQLPALGRCLPAKEPKQAQSLIGQSALIMFLAGVNEAVDIPGPAACLVASGHRLSTDRERSQLISSIFLHWAMGFEPSWTLIVTPQCPDARGRHTPLGLAAGFILQDNTNHKHAPARSNAFWQQNLSVPTPAQA